MQLRRDFLRALEATLVGLFFVQSIRFLYAALYARISSADLVRRLPDEALDLTLPGVVEVAEVQTEIFAVIATLLAPLLASFIARTRWSLPLAVAFCVVGRSLAVQLPESAVLASAVTVAAGFLYMTLLAIRRPGFFPVMLAAAMVGDQFIRASNWTVDPTFDPDYSFFLLGQVELGIDIALVIVALFMLVWTAITTWVEREETRMPGYVRRNPGVLTFWGALALGGYLYLQFVILGLPNAVARWAAAEYYLVLPLVMLATALPLVPEVRSQAGRFLSIFDGIYRGWLWVLILTLLLVIGKRFDGLAAGVMLAIAQFVCVLTLWWMVRVPEQRLRLNPTPILMLLAALVFVVLSIGDYFTYDYAFVRPFEEPFTIMEDVLRGMRGLGLPLALIAGVLACLPMILERQVLPWREGKVTETILTLALALVVTVSGTRTAIPDPIRRPLNIDCLRVATLNLHSGYTQFFAPNLEDAAALIEATGADIVLLQEVETGRLSSGSTDQVYWLANRLDMNETFFAQNEDLQGLAILSRLDVAEADGALLTSEGPQAAVQYVRYVLDESGELHVYNLWLAYLLAGRDGLPIPQNEQDQVIQLDEVYRLVANNHFSQTDAANDRVVWGGTFNYGEESPLYQRIEETVFEDPFIGLFAEDRYTFQDILGTPTRWDYLWLLNLTVNGYSINLRDVVSDHRMSVVEVGRVTGQAC